MRHVRLFRTASFRLAAAFAVIFLSLTGILVGTVYWTVEDTQTRTLLTAIDVDIQAISSGYRELGLVEAVEVVQQLTPQMRANERPDSYLLLIDQRQGRLAGNVSNIPRQLGMFSTSVTQTSADNATRPYVLNLIGKGVLLEPDVYLFVGRDTRSITILRQRILVAFTWIAVIAVLLAAAGGVLLSVQFTRRIDDFTRTCEAIIAGHFNDRIAVRGKSDELDRLAIAINSMLDRIAALLDNLRQVSSDIAHDLRTPLSHLRQRLETARVKSVSLDDYSIAVTRAIDDTDQLLSIFNALLRISQIEAGTRAAAFTSVDLSKMLNELCEMYRPVAEDRQQTLTCDIAADIHIDGDAELIHQLCINIVENALHHTPAGTLIHIALHTERDQVSMVIRDNGPGIPIGERGRVFQRFYRLAQSRSTPGNGLGLALVAAIAQLHRANVELSDCGPGLQVRICFTLVPR